MRKTTAKPRARLTASLAPGYDKVLMSAVWILILFGTAMIASVAVGQTTSSATAVITTVTKQAAFVAVSYFVMWFFDRYFTIPRFLTLRPVIIFGFAALMGVCFMYPAVYGSHAWINLGFMTIQPSEFGKPLMILVVASTVYRRRLKPQAKYTFAQYFKIPILFLLLDLFLIVLQKDFGTAAITAGIFYFCTMIPARPGLKLWQRRLTLILSCGLILGAVLVYSGILTQVLSHIPGMAHIAVRIENMINPYTDVYGEGYQPANALYGIASSGFFGRGYGNSARKYGYLTQADNDYILAVIIEETGIFGLLILAGCYAVIEYRLFGYAFRTRDTVNKVILAGTGSYLFLHFILNVGGVSGLIPMTGIPLLFISSGGSSLMAVSAAIGVCQRAITKIRRQELRHSETERKTVHESSVLRNL